MASTFDGVMAFAFMISMILVGTIARAKIGFLRNALVPASLIGGILGFVLIAAGLSFGNSAADFTAFTFHFFTLSFMSLVLTGSEKGATKGTIVPGGTWLSVLWVMSLVMQAIIGIGVIAAYDAVSGEGLSFFLGAIVTHGFTQGPGQALAMGSIWEHDLGVTHAINFGLIYASIGFIAAFLIGVPVARHAIKAGINFNRAARIDDEFLTEPFTGLTARENDQSTIRVLYAGNIGEGQGLHAILPDLARRMTSRMSFRIIGAGGREPALRQAIADNNIQNIEILPPVDRSKLIEEYAQAQVLFLHLNSYEAFEKVLPSKVFEYAATGKPVWAGVAGFAADFIRCEVSNSAVFHPCDAAAAEQVFANLKLRLTRRDKFISRYARKNIMRSMVADMLELLPGEQL